MNHLQWIIKIFLACIQLNSSAQKCKIQTFELKTNWTNYFLCLSDSVYMMFSQSKEFKYTLFDYGTYVGDFDTCIVIKPSSEYSTNELVIASEYDELLPKDSILVEVYCDDDFPRELLLRRLFISQGPRFNSVALDQEGMQMLPVLDSIGPIEI